MLKYSSKASFLKYCGEESSYSVAETAGILKTGLSEDEAVMRWGELPLWEQPTMFHCHHCPVRFR